MAGTSFIIRTLYCVYQSLASIGIDDLFGTRFFQQHRNHFTSRNTKYIVFFIHGQIKYPDSRWRLTPGFQSYIDNADKQFPNTSDRAVRYGCITFLVLPVLCHGIMHTEME